MSEAHNFVYYWQWLTMHHQSVCALVMAAATIAIAFAGIATWIAMNKQYSAMKKQQEVMKRQLELQEGMMRPYVVIELPEIRDPQTKQEVINVERNMMIVHAYQVPIGWFTVRGYLYSDGRKEPLDIKQDGPFVAVDYPSGFVMKKRVIDGISRAQGKIYVFLRCTYAAPDSLKHYTQDTFFSLECNNSRWGRSNSASCWPEQIKTDLAKRRSEESSFIPAVDLEEGAEQS